VKFLAGARNFRPPPRVYVAQHHWSMFHLTALKLSRRIIKGMAAGVLLKAQ
jgi:hypothetical protein